MQQTNAHASAKRPYRARQVGLFDDPESIRIARQQEDRLLADETPLSWSDEEVFHLHVLLLKDLKHLAERDYPLAHKFELLRWVFIDRENEPDRENAPFSFANCLKVCCGFKFTGHLSNPALGLISAESIREELEAEIKPWFKAMLAKLPKPVQKIIRGHPEEAEKLFLRNAQFLNEQLLQRRRSKTDDFFDEFFGNASELFAGDGKPLPVPNLDLGQKEALDVEQAMRNDLIERKAAMEDRRRDRRLDSRLQAIVEDNDWEERP